MASGVKWDGANSKMEPPAGHEAHVASISAFRTSQVCVTCWQLTPEELAEVIASGGKVFLSIFYGGGMPPAFVGSESQVRELLVDYGPVWKMEKLNDQG